MAVPCNPVTRQFGGEIVCLETVFARVFGKRAERPDLEDVAGELLEQQ